MYTDPDKFFMYWLGHTLYIVQEECRTAISYLKFTKVVVLVPMGQKCQLKDEKLERKKDRTSPETYLSRSSNSLNSASDKFAFLIRKIKVIP